MKRYIATWLVLALVLAPVVCLADTVVLAGGKTVEGTVQTTRDTVRIKGARGTLEIPRGRVERILRAGEQHMAAPAEARPEREPAPAAVEAEPAAEAGPKSQRSPARPRPGPVAGSVRAALQQRIDVAFESATLSNVIDYLRQVLDVNIVVHPDVQMRAETVTMQLNDVLASTVLRLLAEMNDLHYDVRYGNILFLAPRSQAPYLVRLYPVHDVLVSSEDVQAQGAEGGGENGDDEGFNLQIRFQPQFRDGGEGGDDDAAFGAGDDGAHVLHRRALHLVQLMRSTCGPGTWAPMWQQPVDGNQGF